MPLPAVLRNLPLPIIGAPLFIVSNPEARHRAVHGRHRRLDAGAERAAGRAARRMAGRDHRDARRARPRPPRAAGGAVRDQPDRPQEQRPARARHGGVREVQGADRHHLARRAHRRQRRGARLGRHRACTTSSTTRFAQEGDREGRRRPDRGRGRRGRPCRREEPVRADRRRSATGSTARSRCRGAIATGGAVLAAQAMGADFAYVGSAFIATEEARAADAYKQMIVDEHQRRHRLLAACSPACTATT